VKKGSEEYLDSEKYQLRHRDWNAAGNINADIERINRLRREQPALQRFDNVTFHESENPVVLFYVKGELASGRVGNPLLVAITTDAAKPQESMVHVPLGPFGLGENDQYVVHDLLSGAKYTWRGSRNYVRLDPVHGPIAHIFVIERNR
jgi:starch synthase (maltosyl-transferring)